MDSVVPRLLIAITLSIGGIASEKNRCCPEGQHMTQETDTLYSCLDIKSNSRADLLLTCGNGNTNNTAVYNEKELAFHVDEEGKLIIDLQDMQIEIESGTYCTGNFTIKAPSGVRYYLRAAATCYEEGKETNQTQEKLLGSLMIISTVFLFGTASVYLALPELRDLQGKSIINFCISLGAGLACLSAMKLIEEYSDMKLCATRGFLTYFFLIAAFFWSNAISIQILLNTRQPTKTAYEWKEFVWYALYAWGCPSILTIAMAAVNFMPGKHRKPGIGLNHCWFFDRDRQWEYMYSVISILILMNIGIFIYTSIVLWRYSFWKYSLKAPSPLKATRYKFYMIVWLSIVMGIPWIFEMVGSLLAPGHIIWIFVDCLNSLQGLWIFLVLVVFRRRVIKLMHQHGWLEWLSGPVERWLAAGQDEEDVAQHTLGVTMDEVNKREIRA